MWKEMETGASGEGTINPTLLSKTSENMTFTVSCNIGDTIIVSSVNIESAEVQTPTVTGGTIELFEYGTAGTISAKSFRNTILVVKATATSVTVICTTNYNNLRSVVIKV